VPDDLTLELCEPTTAQPPTGWAEFVRTGALHPVWHWPLVRTLAAARRGAVVAGMLRDGERVTGLVVARLLGPAGGRAPAVADVECPGSMSLPGLALPGGLPGALAPPEPPDPALAAAAVHAFEAALRREYGRRILAVCYRQVYADALPVLARGIAVVYRGGDVAVFHNRFADYDSYLAGLSTSRRKDQSRLVRRTDADPGVTVEFGPVPPGFDVAEFHALAEQTDRRNHRRRWPPRRRLSRQYHAALAALPDVKLLRYTDGAGALLGGTITFDHPAVPLAGPWAALDPHDGGRTGIWFEHLARSLRWIIESGRGGFIAGKGLMPQKAALGFAAVPQWTVLRRLGRG
jgi:hypothetical protein